MSNMRKLDKVYLPLADEQIWVLYQKVLHRMDSVRQVKLLFEMRHNSRLIEEVVIIAQNKHRKLKHQILVPRLDRQVKFLFHSRALKDYLVTREKSNFLPR